MTSKFTELAIDCADVAFGTMAIDSMTWLA